MMNFFVFALNTLCFSSRRSYLLFALLNLPDRLSRPFLRTSVLFSCSANARLSTPLSMLTCRNFSCMADLHHPKTHRQTMARVSMARMRNQTKFSVCPSHTSPTPSLPSAHGPPASLSPILRNGSDTPIPGQETTRRTFAGACGRPCMTTNRWYTTGTKTRPCATHCADLDVCRWPLPSSSSSSVSESSCFPADGAAAGVGVRWGGDGACADALRTGRRMAPAALAAGSGAGCGGGSGRRKGTASTGCLAG